NVAALGVSLAPAVAAQPEQAPVQQTANFEKAKVPAQQSHYPPGTNPEAAKPPVIVPSDLGLVGQEVPALPPDMPMPSQPALPGCDQVKKSCTSGKLLLVNNPHISMAYRIEDEGKSGVGKVEVWITKDGGRTWDVL